MRLDKLGRILSITVLLTFVQPVAYGADPIITARQQIFQGGVNNGKPIDGSPLMTCPAGQTLSIDFGPTSWAYCLIYPTPTPTTTTPTTTTETTTATTTPTTTTPTTTTPTTTTPTTTTPTTTTTTTETTTSTTRTETTTSTTRTETTTSTTGTPQLVSTQPNTTRFNVEGRQLIYDNPCRYNICNNSWSTDEEARIAYARQGKPIDGSALIICSPGYTRSIDYGRPSYALCIDFRVNLDAPDNPYGTIQPTTSQTDTRTAITSQTDTRTATTSQTDTRTATTSQIDTRTATRIQTEFVIGSIINADSRTSSAATYLVGLATPEKEQMLSVIPTGKKQNSVIILLDLPGIKVVVTASKKGSKTITFKTTTNEEGDAVIKTSKVLAGFLVTLAVNNVKLDSDLVKK